jgi:hypothetical protein
MDSFLPISHSNWLLKWIPTLCNVLVKKATEAPRVSKLYSILCTVLKISSKYQYFENQEEVESTDRKHTFNMLLTFIKDLVGKSEEF